MQAYELLVASLLEREGFWVPQSFKVALTKDDKKKILRPCSPRWEIDLLAYRPGDNQLRQQLMTLARARLLLGKRTHIF